MTETIDFGPTAATEETAGGAHEAISSRRVEGTPVFDRRGAKIGSIHSVMIHKRTGQVSQAILTFGGFLGLGSRAYPLPWAMLTFDPELRGYSLDLRREDIEDAPYMTLDQADRPHRANEPAYRYWDQYL